MLNSKRIDPAKPLSFDWRNSISASHAAAWVLSMSNEELSVSWPTIFSALVPTNSATEAPYQNRSDASLSLTVDAAVSITGVNQNPIYLTRPIGVRRLRSCRKGLSANKDRITRDLLTPYLGKAFAVFGDEAVDPCRDNGQRHRAELEHSIVKSADVEFETRSFPNLLVATLATLPSMSVIPSAPFAPSVLSAFSRARTIASSPI